MQERRRHVVAIADGGFRGVGRDHAMAGIIEQQPCQQMVGLATYDGAMGPLGEGFLSDRFKQRAIHDQRLLARQDLVLVFYLADIEVVTQQIVQRAAAERDATAGRTRRKPFNLGPDVALPEVPNQFVDAAEFEVALEDRSDQLSLFFDNGNPAVLHLISERKVAPDPDPFSLRCCDLVADALRGDLPLELAKDRSTLSVSRP